MRYRVEIYDANKAHDLTFFYKDLLNREGISKLLNKNKKRFQGNVKSYIVDTEINKKVFAAYFPAP